MAVLMHDSNFRVFVRCRTKHELAPIAYNVVSPSVLVRKETGRKYSFDRVFASQQDQAEIFRHCALPLVDEFLRGYNGTMFAYGQTGTGKTYTMTGDCKSTDDAAAGIVPRVLQSVFQKLNESQREEWSLELRYIELYNEELRDLLDPSSPTAKRGAKQLRIAENQQTRSTEVVGATSHAVTTFESALAVIQSAQGRRQTAATLLNSDSSRSHTVLTLVLVVREPVSGMAVRSKLHLVDLAGSESVAKSGAQRQRAVEAGEINKSLLALGRVIEALVDTEKLANGKPRHVSYRSSKLTQLLQDSLGGATKTSMVATVSLLQQDADETKSTLEYASRARSIKNQQQTEVELLDTLPTIKEMSRRLEEVQRELSAQRNRDGCVCISNSRYEQLASGEQKASKLLAQHETASRHERAQAEALQRENVKLESQLIALANEHRNCSNAALSQSRLQQAITALSDASTQHAALSTETCKSLFEKLSELPASLSKPLSELRSLVASQSTDSELQKSCERAVRDAFDDQENYIRARISEMVAVAENEVKKTINGVMKELQETTVDIQRPFKDAATLATHLAGQIEEIQRRIAKEQAANSEAMALARDLMKHEQRHSEALQLLQEASLDRQALTRRLIDSGKTSSTHFPQLSTHASSAGQCAANIEEVLARRLPEIPESVSEAALEDILPHIKPISNEVVHNMEQVRSFVSTRVCETITTNEERTAAPVKLCLESAVAALSGLQRDTSKAVSHHEPEVAAYKAKIASLQKDMRLLLQQASSVPLSPQRSIAAFGHKKSPARNAFAQSGVQLSRGSPHKRKPDSDGLASPSRPGSRPRSKDEDARVLQNLGNQLNTRLRMPSTPKLSPSDQPLTSPSRRQNILRGSTKVVQPNKTRLGAVRKPLSRPHQSGGLLPTQKRARQE